jgi:hypothetical protein
METPTLNRFSAVEVRDMVIQAEGDVGVVLESYQEVRLASVQIDHRSPRPCLRIAGAQGVSMTGREITAVGPNTPAVVFENIAGDCQLERNRFVGGRELLWRPSRADHPTAEEIIRQRIIRPPASRAPQFGACPAQILQQQRLAAGRWRGRDLQP